jgi:hypothetical protein
MALAERDESPEKAFPTLRQLEHEPKGRGGGTAPVDGDVELATAREPRPVGTLNQAGSPLETDASGLDLATGAVGLGASSAGRRKASDLLPPLPLAENDGDGRRFLPRWSHEPEIGRTPR